MFLEDVDEVVGVLLADIFDAEVVDNQHELDRAPGVAPEPGCRRGFMVAGGVEALAQEVVGELAGLRKSVGAADDLEVHPLVADECVEVVLGAELLGDVCIFYADVLLAFHLGRLEVEVARVEAGKLGAGVGRARC